MKKTISILVSSLLMMGCISAQPSAAPVAEKTFISTMETNLKILDTVSTGATLTMLANSFERIGNAEKKYWEP